MIPSLLLSIILTLSKLPIYYRFGPEGGDKGGTLLACGTPEEVAKNKKSYTGQYIKQALAQAKKHGWYQ